MSTASPPTGAPFGERVARIEDAPLVRGRGCYVGDLNFSRQLHMRIVRSPYAHARLISIDTQAARALPGVVAVWTAEDIPELSPIDFRDPAGEALAPYRQPVLARERVRYVGEPVAAIFATGSYVAEDAADLVLIEAEELPILLDATAPPGHFFDAVSTEALVLRAGYGDTAEAFANAPVVVEISLDIGRHSGVPLETRGAIGRYDAAKDILELWGAAKVPHRNRDNLMRALGRSASGIVLHELHVGGGFGIRGELYPEDFLVLAAAMRLDRPVKWIEDRREHLMAANHSRQQHHRIRLAADKSGILLGLEDEFFHDQGAYVRTHGARVPDITIGTMAGPYRIPAYACVGHFRLTNKTPAATYRAPGRFESSFVRERAMDALAARLDLDPAELRRRNMINAAEMPYDCRLTVLGQKVVYDSGDYALLLGKALERFGWERVRADVARRRAHGALVGVGLAAFVEDGGMGPRDVARVSVDPTGAVEIVTGGASVGQGFETAMAQICAASLGVDMSRIRVVHGQTDRIAFGVGAHASRATVMTGNATHVTALAVRAKALRHAAMLLQCDTAALDIVDGAVIRLAAPADPVMTLAEIARHLAPDSPTLGSETPGLSAEEWFRTPHTTHPYGLAIIQAEVDRATGAVRIERALIAYDVGRSVNPMLVEAQLVGGFAQGLGGALYEEFRYDERGEPLSVTFADYLLPTASEMPVVDVLLTEDAPSPLNPLGIKGAGEGGTTGAGAAVAAAVADALGSAALITALPVTPQRIRAILRGMLG